MSYLNKAQILSAQDIECVDVDVPEWGGTVRVALMSGAARDDYEGSLIRLAADGTAQRDLTNIRAKLVAVCLVDDNGERLFSESDVKALGAKSCAALDRVYHVAARLNRLTQGEVEDAAKNS
ncbi:hypothetical protein O5O45_06930 [Hahella aquimaris]|uniref:hypothetical protein n=1 Tax=Hahella sp. HNIBRBA332 TaxID=3015983 RepID=UPI00273BDBE1|nr:hypothetical protein [Hahella sp. HNIBRBA332]WLQ15649.1 hypothetical protein O5O45_06930 [Hahella sp. HNIBRBA332]